MGQLGQSRGNAFVFAPAALSFARHYDFALKACDARDAKRKELSPHCTSYESCMAAFFDCPGPGGLPIGLNGATAGTW